MKTTAEKIAVMQAYQDGKTIVFGAIGEEKKPWTGSANCSLQPEWNWSSFDYDVELTEDDYNKKALRLYLKTPGTNAEQALRVVINAVKRGEIK